MSVELRPHPSVYAARKQSMKCIQEIENIQEIARNQAAGSRGHGAFLACRHLRLFFRSESRINAEWPSHIKSSPTDFERLFLILLIAVHFLYTPATRENGLDI